MEHPGKVVERGEIRDPKKIARLRDFRGLRWGNITPTDIDGMLELWGRYYIFLEAKHAGGRLFGGQRLAYERLARDLAESGKPTLVLVLSEVGPEPINYAKCIVSEACVNGVWSSIFNGNECRAVIDTWLKTLS